MSKMEKTSTILVVSNWGRFPMRRQEFRQSSVELIFGSEQCDFSTVDMLIVLDDLPSTHPALKVKAKKSVAVVLESSEIYRPCKRFLRQFDRIYTYRRDLGVPSKKVVNFAPWHVGVMRSTAAIEDSDKFHLAAAGVFLYFLTCQRAGARSF